jgi:hypothetical protein
MNNNPARQGMTNDQIPMTNAELNPEPIRG